ncbi:hypothetical protein F511_28512 [Dorcoceras hygrometricum]|uniref:Uncharacterized protein n=1 Tax=Dorcoceras hygrometricum TaxID=472368 RepID=A0A2Z7AZ57_9LAMI|nr:hypothetical protein F511_28512 [Dorcoceras hygrometricum]
MVVDLIGIYGLKRPYFLETESIGPIGSAIGVTMKLQRWISSFGPGPVGPVQAAPLSPKSRRRRPPPPPPLIDRTCSDQFFEENPSALISSGLLVLADEGVSLPVVDLIDESTAAYREEPVSLRFWLEPGACRQQGSRISILPPPILNKFSLISMRELRIQYLCDPQWFRDTSSRGLTTFVTPKPHFRTNPSDHGKASSNIAP